MDEANIVSIKIEPLPVSFLNNEDNDQVPLTPKNEVKVEIEDFEDIPIKSKDIKIDIEETDMKKECFGDTIDDSWDKNQKDGPKKSEQQERVAEENLPNNEDNIEEIQNESITGKKSYICDICSKSCANQSHLVVHKRIHTGEKPYSCDLCEKTFYMKTHLISHKRVHTREKPYTCDVCLKTFSVKSNLITHRRIHTGEKPYSCDVCQKAFGSVSTLIKHKGIHTRDKPYSCDACHIEFKYSSDFIMHKCT